MQAKGMRLIILALLLTGLGLAIYYREYFNAQLLGQWVEEAGVAGPLLFILIYALGTLFFLPGSVMTLAGGALFGPLAGTFYNITGATLGAVCAFIAARYLASDWVETKSGGRLRQLKHGVEGEGWRFVAFVRLVPLFPFNLLNYALGLTRIPLAHYAIASYLFMLPGAIAYTYLGYVGREAMAGSEDLIQKAMLALMLLAIVGFLPGLVSRLRRGALMMGSELHESIEEGSGILVLDVRTEKEFNGELGHIKGALNIPLDQLEERLQELESYKEGSIALVCHSDRRSGKAAQILTRNGFDDVHVVMGGMVQWNQLDYPVVRTV